MTTEFNESQTLKNIIDTQNDTIKTYHNIMMMQETEIARLKERIKELEAEKMSVSKWRYTEECNGRPCPGDCDHCSFEPGDLISRADAIKCCQCHGSWDCINRIKALPSAETKPTVVRCKTMIPYGDFREWAKRIREDNPNVIVIPFDAEVASADAESDDLIIKGAKGIQDGLYNIKDGKLFKYKGKGGTVRTYPIVPSADAVQGWIPCTERLPSESDDYLCTIPLDADETYTEVLTFHKGRFYEDDDEWGATYHDDVLAWQPLPTPYKGGDDE